MRVRRLTGNPIIAPGMPGLSPEAAANINGPALIRVPDWVPNPLGRYYLYFAHHTGTYIRLAYADALAGPWTIHEPGALRLDQTPFTDHIASPDAYVDHDARQIRLYVHGGLKRGEYPPEQGEIDDFFYWNQRTRVALSPDGLHFTSQPQIITSGYLRIVPFKGMFYGLTMPGLMYRSPDGLTDFEQGPIFFGARTDFSQPGAHSVRHMAILPEDDERLHIFLSRFEDEPERIRRSIIDARAADWHDWIAGPLEDVLAPETDYEGANLPLEPSRRGAIHTRVRQVRDPAIYLEDGRVYLLYTIAGESGIAIAEIEEL